MKRHATPVKLAGVLLGACLVIGPQASLSMAQESQDQAPPVVKLKSEKKATTLSLVGTLVPWALFLTFGLREGHGDEGAEDVLALLGFFAIPVGPSLGHFYAGATGRGLAGMGIRLVGLAAAIACGFAVDYNDGNSSLAFGLAVAGLGVTVVSSILDITRAKRSVQKYNLRASGKQMAVTPVVSLKTRTVGLQVQISF